MLQHEIYAQITDPREVRRLVGEHGWAIDHRLVFAQAIERASARS